MTLPAIDGTTSALLAVPESITATTSPLPVNPAEFINAAPVIRLLYSKPSLNHRITTSTVYELNGKKTAYTSTFKYNKEIKPAPSTVLKNIGLRASETPTTLWWDKTDISKNRMETLISCGQFTTCYKLLDYIVELKKEEELKEKIDVSAIDKLYKLLLKDWKKFNENPLFLVEELKQ